MLKLLIQIFLCFCWTSIIAQSLEFSVGYTRNRFYDWHKETPYFETKYPAGNGYSISVSIDDIDTKIHPLRFSLRLTNYKGKFKINSGVKKSSSFTNAQIERYSLEAIIYPLNIEIFHNFRFSFGGVINYILQSKINGYQNQYDMISGYSSDVIDENIIDPDVLFFLGIIWRAAYNIKIKNDWIIVPQYLFYLGFSNEFSNIPADIKSYRHYFEIGISRKLKGRQKKDKP